MKHELYRNYIASDIKERRETLPALFLWIPGSKDNSIYRLKDTQYNLKRNSVTQKNADYLEVSK